MRRPSPIVRVLAAVALLLGSTLAAAAPASAAVWPNGCKVTSLNSAPYITVSSYCPRNQHQVVAWCAPNGGSTAYKVVGRVVSAGYTSWVQCTNSRLVKTDLVTWRST